jgi:hypothetical protein
MSTEVGLVNKDLSVFGKSQPSYEAHLHEVWVSDKTRPWHIFSDEIFSHFWDFRQVEHRR